MTALPILNTLGEGPKRGILVMSYRFNSVEISKISKVMGYPLNLTLYHPQSEKAKYNGDGINVSILDNNSIRGSILINDIYGRIVLKIESIFPRTFYSQGQMVWYSLWFISYLLFLLLLLLL